MKDKGNFFCRKTTLNCNGKLLIFSVPKVMGILNVTPDSFYDGGRYNSEELIINRAKKILEEGGEIIDIGACSTRPGAEEISAEEELKRLIPAVNTVRKNFPDVIISADTYRAGVAEEAVSSGADMINDVSGGTLDKDMFSTVGRLKVPYILMHIQGNPRNMQLNPKYEHMAREVFYYFSEKLLELRSLGVNDIILDPGFGFGKTLAHNYELLDALEALKIFELPVMAGISRKSMVNKVLDIKAADALNGTTVLNTMVLQKGVNILRVHDVKEAVEAVKIFSFAQDNRLQYD